MTIFAKHNKLPSFNGSAFLAPPLSLVRPLAGNSISSHHVRARKPSDDPPEVWNSLSPLNTQTPLPWPDVVEVPFEYCFCMDHKGCGIDYSCPLQGGESVAEAEAEHLGVGCDYTIGGLW